MKITCECGNESEFEFVEKDQREFFKHKEEISIGYIEGFSFSIHNPLGAQIEIICKKCGKICRAIRRV